MQHIRDDLGRMRGSPVTDAELNASIAVYNDCLLYTSDAADERSSVDLGGRRILKKKKR